MTKNEQPTLNSRPADRGDADCQAFAGIALPNPSSVALHEAVGFTPIGIYRSVGFKHGSWHDVGWWQKTLQLPAQPIAPRAPR